MASSSATARAGCPASRTATIANIRCRRRRPTTAAHGVSWQARAGSFTTATIITARSAASGSRETMSQSAIESVLAHDHGGVYFLPGDVDARKVQAAAKKAKLTFVHVDGRNVQRKEQLMTALATALRLPAHFGRNWDALEECLTDLAPEEGRGYFLLYDHIDGLLEAHPDQFQTLVEILRDAVESWKEDDTAMVVVLAGAKAPKGVAKATASS